MARNCNECGGEVPERALVYLAKKVQLDFCDRDCEQAYAGRHSNRPHGTFCDYCMYFLKDETRCEPRLSIKFGKYVVDYCCPQHRTKWFSKHRPQENVIQHVNNFRLTLNFTDSARFEQCQDLSAEDVVDGCEAFDLVDLADYADLATGGIPVFTVIRLLGE
jgi:hypothetical protein